MEVRLEQLQLHEQQPSRRVHAVDAGVDDLSRASIRELGRPLECSRGVLRSTTLALSVGVPVASTRSSQARNSGRRRWKSQVERGSTASNALQAMGASHGWASTVQPSAESAAATRRSSSAMAGCAVGGEDEVRRQRRTVTHHQSKRLPCQRMTVCVVR